MRIACRTGWLFLGVLTIGTAACTMSESPADRVPEPLQKVTVFTRGEAGYHCFRIPALVVTPRGTVLAFAEGRKDSCRDDADIDLVLKRSTDQGLTRGPLQVLFDDGDL